MTEQLLVAAQAVIAVLLAVVGFLLKKQLDKLDGLIKAHGECQLNLAKTYMTKAESEVDSKRQWDKIDDHGNRLVRLETLVDDGK